MNDSISRRAAIAYAISGRTREFEGEKWIRVLEVRESLQTMPSAQPYTEAEIQKMQDLEQVEIQKAFELGKSEANMWIPVKYRPMDSEEREYWEDQFGEELADEDAVMFDCPMPEDGQEILVSYRKWINMDKCEIDGGCYGLEGNGDWEDVLAWMPLPEPYREERTEE